MDYFKVIEELQEEFKKNPREGIIRFLETEKQNDLSKLGMDLENLLILKNFHLEYAMIVGGLMKARILDVGKLMMDHNDEVSNAQRRKEWVDTLQEFKRNVNEITSLRLSRAYASAMEIMWKKLKRIIAVAGLNPKNKHINIPTLMDKLEKIEELYSINLESIKNYVDSELRNYVGHESTMFIPPNYISFLDTKGTKSNEVKRLTTDDIYKLLLNTIAMLIAFSMVDSMTIASRLEPLLRLTDDELDEYMKTGILTEEMQNKMYKSH